MTEDSLGVTSHSVHTINGRVTRIEVDGISVLRGLPSILFQGVTVHELGHAWLAVQGVQGLPSWAEEGFCELLAYRFYKELNTPESRYHVESIEKNTNLRDWVPAWCFPFIFWAANRVGGTVSGRLDWFAGKGLKLAPNSTPKTVGDLVDENRVPLSDHDAITLEFVISDK